MHSYPDKDGDSGDDGGDNGDGFSKRGVPFQIRVMGGGGGGGLNIDRRTQQTCS